ncbi:MAG: redox-sensing transcriptional repressor Rex [Bacilli bacterium]|nr:redox-sensing transcriptional repressor Rex [Bacilli bacterium]
MSSRFSPKQLERYPIYLKLLKEERAKGETVVSSPKLAAVLGYSEEQIRKDFQAISTTPGIPKKGRMISYLIEDIESFLGYTHPKKAVVIGVGHMGGALMNFHSFPDMGLTILAGFDNNPELIGEEVGGKKIFALDDLQGFTKDNPIDIAVIAVPSAIAEEVAQKAYACGIRAFWNFAPVMVTLPYDAVIENVNLASSLAVLSHKIDRKTSMNQ